jgi:hypothetical protein
VDQCQRRKNSVEGGIRQRLYRISGGYALGALPFSLAPKRDDQVEWSVGNLTSASRDEGRAEADEFVKRAVAAGDRAPGEAPAKQDSKEHNDA